MATITVTTASDDLTPGDGSVSLREAITAINAGNDLGDGDITAQNPGTFGAPGIPDQIAFNIAGGGPATISLTSSLPLISKPVSLDATTQPGFAGSPLITIDGSSAGSVDWGIETEASSTTIRGFIVQNIHSGSVFPSAGITVSNFGVVGRDVVAGNVVTGNDVGINAYSVSGFVIGGITPADRNVASGNKYDGIDVESDPTGQSVVEGNYVGVAADGVTPLPNGRDGIANGSFTGGDGSFRVGGSLPEQANIIAFNKGNGVSFFASAIIRLNSIYSNGLLGIKHPGSAANDPGDIDEIDQPGTPIQVISTLQNHPVLTGAIRSGGNVAISGLLNSNANTAFALDFYANPTPDASGAGEGQTYLGSISLITDAAGNATFNATVPTALAAGNYITATATNVADEFHGETSEFAPDVLVTSSERPLTVVGVSPAAVVEGAAFSGQLVHFTDGDPQAFAGDYTATIDWGDSTTTAGTVAVDSGGGFDVSGSHTYANEGTNPIKITINDTAGRNDAGGATIAASTTGTVADAPITVKATTLGGGKEGRLLSGTVATFSDANIAAPVGDFTASVSWGDGSTTAGVIHSNGSGTGNFYVTAGHTYAEASAGYPVKVSLVDVGGSSASVSSIAKIAESPLDQAVGRSQKVSAKVAFTNLTLGTFRDQDSLNTHPGDYAGTINWGDGSATSAARFAFAGSTPSVGSFWKAQGSHTYMSKKTFAVTITLVDTANPAVKLLITMTVTAG